MRIKDTIEKVPGGMMVIPLIMGALINTIYPQILEIGGFTTAIARGSNAILGVFLFCMGASMEFKTAPKALKVGLVQTLSKLLVGVVLGLLVSKLFGDNGFLGLSSLAVIAALTNTNGGLYTALTAEFGNKSEVGAIAIISINDGPFLTMIALGTAGIATIPFMALLGVVLPIALGMILGNLDPKMRKFLAGAGAAMIPFFAFSLGCGINMEMIYKAGLPGIILGLVTVLIGGFINISADKASGGTGVAGAANSSTAGNAVATPAAVALVDPSLSAIAAIAAPQVAASTITTALLVPVLTTIMAKRNKNGNFKRIIN
ncbi:MAG: 2-keto-3-deoxygluconate permease [Prolixibacteraceae bacterium]|jgi:2-keto-3-deoxygluconate permease|nr:2-keto-3-deoxygluconate permease [Prolixibacteraceae bacterium]MBT6765188.1 2-keto-3-deoxygluconate permease [Prolixibacteraceae bacterium]MBT7000635.1 2-keto-3-deoxygluconate permease [Prolixibacteraceae bacterium]MBT7396196.1 2-keto-3-deoxygluconate permease [Prolixibacteraceae bacterium]